MKNFEIKNNMLSCNYQGDPFHVDLNKLAGFRRCTYSDVTVLILNAREYSIDDRECDLYEALWDYFYKKEK